MTIVAPNWKSFWCILEDKLVRVAITILLQSHMFSSVTITIGIFIEHKC